jgi:hypothetical protein
MHAKNASLMHYCISTSSSLDCKLSPIVESGKQGKHSIHIYQSLSPTRHVPGINPRREKVVLLVSSIPRDLWQRARRRRRPHHPALPRRAIYRRLTCPIITTDRVCLAGRAQRIWPRRYGRHGGCRGIRWRWIVVGGVEGELLHAHAHVGGGGRVGGELGGGGGGRYGGGCAVDLETGGAGGLLEVVAVGVDGLGFAVGLGHHACGPAGEVDGSALGGLGECIGFLVRVSPVAADGTMIHSRIVLGELVVEWGLSIDTWQ